jgi:hypothetical protein
MLRKLIFSLMALTVAVGVVVAGSEPAEARRGGVVAGALVGGLVAGALIAGASRPSYAYSYGPACYAGPRRCEWAGRHCFYNRWGDYVCRGGEYRCWRPTICD